MQKWHLLEVGVLEGTFSLIDVAGCRTEEMRAPVSHASAWVSILYRACPVALSIEWKSCPDLFQVWSIEQRWHGRHTLNPSPGGHLNAPDTHLPAHASLPSRPPPPTYLTYSTFEIALKAGSLNRTKQRVRRKNIKMSHFWERMLEYTDQTQ